ncbi:MAG: tetratricopeptide repeat protein [Nitrospinae bacterium]|nr:tetratricopeptide repeat protein [Nitrospinota bacterium]MBF0635176.1 tetratricopeptide repeat protein [Nitrospinota bacterium]
MAQTDKTLRALFEKYAKKRITIILENKSERKQIRNVFREDGLSDILEFDLWNEAWEKLKLATTSILIFSVDHPDGMDFLRHLIESMRFRKTPMIVFTARIREYPKHFTNTDAHIRWVQTPFNALKAEQALIDTLKKGVVERSSSMDESKALEHYNRGIEAMERGAHEEAKEHFRLALKESPDFFECYIKMADTLFQMGDTEAALRVLGKADTMSPDHPKALMLKANIAAETLEKETALKVLDLAVSKRRNDLMFIIEIGNIALAKGWIDEAIGYFEMAQDIDPDLIHVYNRLGIAQSRASRFDKALAMYNKALSMDETDAGLHFNVGMLHHRKGEDVKALEYFRKAASLDKGMKEAHDMIGKLEGAK